MSPQENIDGEAEDREPEAQGAPSVPAESEPPDTGEGEEDSTDDLDRDEDEDEEEGGQAAPPLFAQLRPVLIAAAAVVGLFGLIYGWLALTAEETESGFPALAQVDIPPRPTRPPPAAPQAGDITSGQTDDLDTGAAADSLSPTHKPTGFGALAGRSTGSREGAAEEGAAQVATLTPPPDGLGEISRSDDDAESAPLGPPPEPSAILRVNGAIVLPVAPNPDLVTEGEYGLLPVIAEDGRTSWSYYARPFSDPARRPRIAILLGGLGLSQSATLAAIQQLPGEISLGFNPYARDLQNWINQARAAGHEVMLQMPMEPHNYPDNDPGPHTLLTSLDPADNILRSEWLLSRFAGYIGVTNYMGSKFTASKEALRPVLATLHSRGLMFLDSRASSDSVAAVLAREVGLVQASNNRFIDATASRSTIDARLGELERIARNRGSAIGIAFPYPVSIERIAAWAATLPGKQLVLAPISAVARIQHVASKAQ